MSAVRLCSAPRGKPPRGAPLSPAHAYPVAGVTAGSETAAAPKVRTQVAYDGPEGSDLLRYEPYLTHFLPEITDIGNKTCSVKSGTPPTPRRRALRAVTAGFPLASGNGWLLLLQLLQRGRGRGQLTGRKLPRTAVVEESRAVPPAACVAGRC